MSHVHSKGIRVSLGEGRSYLSPAKMFPGLIEKESEPKYRVKKAKMQLRYKISRQTQEKNKMSDLDKINGFADRDHSQILHMPT